MKPICHGCQRFYRIRKTGFYFLEGMPTGNDAKPGTQEPERWKPYKLWAGDKWECEGCGHILLAGFGRGPVAIQHDRNFKTEVARLCDTPVFQVNDC